MSEHVNEVGDADFETAVLQSDLPVVVDFWAPWCGPCRMLAPIVDEVAGQLTGQVKFVKVNVDENPETAGNYGIRSIPTLMWFKDGQRVDMVVGLVDAGALTSRCQAVLA